MHLVHAFVVEQRLLLAQLRGAGKAGELEALPWLLELLEIEGATVTIDAAGCYRNIAAVIRERNAHYLLTLKENQPRLYNSIAQFFLDAQAMNFESVEVDVAQTVERAHGRYEERRAYVLYDLTWCESAEGWRDLNTAVVIERLRRTAEKTETSMHLYISDIERLSASRALQLVREHWAIENGLHWTLDVTFGEDGCRIHHRNGAENFGLVRRVALNTLKHGAKKYDSIRALQKRAGWDEDFLLSQMGASQVPTEFDAPRDPNS
jgi:predicted transposase YbfD/YdcC